MRWRDQTGSVRAAAAAASPAARRAGGGRATIAVLLDSPGHLPVHACWPGIADAARARDVNLAVFAGGVLGAAGSEGLHRNFVFDLCGARGRRRGRPAGRRARQRAGPGAVAELCARLAPMPLATLTLGPPDVPRLTLDQERGMRQAIVHLVAVHGCRRLAFVRGPSMNDEAERRYALYRAVLAEEGLEVDPALICDGTSRRRPARQRSRCLVDERRVTFDALVAANDYMALGAMEALEARGIDVPADVAVIGFDDIEDARFSSPPLTTVRQPLYQQGEAALERVLAQLEGADVALNTVARDGAGRAPVVRLSDRSGRPGRAGPITPHPTRGVEACWPSTATMSLARAGARGPRRRHRAAAGWECQLLDAFEAELRGAGAGLFAADARPPARRRRRRPATTWRAWQRLVSAMRRWLFPALAASSAAGRTRRIVWHEARI